MMTGIVALAAMVALMTLFVAFFYWYCRQIRYGRIDPRMDPEWTSVTGPASPHSLRDHGSDKWSGLEADDVDWPPRE